MLNLESKATGLSVTISDSELEECQIHNLGEASSSAALFSKSQFPSTPERPCPLSASYVRVGLVYVTQARSLPAFERNSAIKWNQHFHSHILFPLEPKKGMCKNNKCRLILGIWSSVFHWVQVFSAYGLYLTGKRTFERKRTSLATSQTEFVWNV